MDSSRESCAATSCERPASRRWTSARLLKLLGASGRRANSRKAPAFPSCGHGAADRHCRSSPQSCRPNRFPLIIKSGVRRRRPRDARRLNSRVNLAKRLGGSPPRSGRSIRQRCPYFSKIYVRRARHVEANSGDKRQYSALYERDCSIQRRVTRKVVDGAPARTCRKKYARPRPGRCPDRRDCPV